MLPRLPHPPTVHLVHRSLWWAAFLGLALVGCGGAPYPHGPVEELFPAGQQQPELSTVQLGGQGLGIARMSGPPVADPAQPMLLFVHGSPGGWKAWAHFLGAPELAGYASRVAVDRPGFGASSAMGVMPDLRQQAALFTELIPPGQKAIVIGHSLGAPLAAWMAIDAPDRVCGVVAIAGSLASVWEAPRWYNHIAGAALLNWALPSAMQRSNLEMMPLQAELQKLETQLPNLQTPMVVMQGGKDTLVDPRTADEVAQRAPSPWLQIQRLPQEGHFVLWEKPQRVTDAIRGLRCGQGATS